jgi:flagellar protein FlgJ
MGSSTVGPTYYADFGGLEGLKKGAKAEDPKAIRAAAAQFESLFTDMMLKSMRAANLGGGLGDSQESDLYQGMYDQQIAVQMSQGKGIGLADMLVQQLTRNAASKAAPASASAAAPVSAPTTVTTPGAASPAPVSRATQIGFVQQLAPYAQRAATQLGVSADTIIAQAALETGWGQHVPGAANGMPSNNLFGLKAGQGWNGASVNAATTEYSQGTAHGSVQPFRAYSSVEQGVNDYVTLLQRNARYGQALGTGADVSAFASGLARGGYATDPDYAQKLAATAASVQALRAANGATSGATPLKLPSGVPTPSGEGAA